METPNVWVLSTFHPKVWKQPPPSQCLTMSGGYTPTVLSRRAGSDVDATAAADWTRKPCLIILIFKLLGFVTSSGPCCTVVKSIPSNSLATCLCVAARASILGLTISIPGDITLLLNICGISVPVGLACP